MFTVAKLLLGVRHWRKAIRNAQLVRQVNAVQAEEVIRNAMAYAFEVGFGAPLTEQVITTKSNPFLSRNWREGILPGSEETWQNTSSNKSQ